MSTWDQLLSILANLAKPAAQPPAMLGSAPLPPGAPMSVYQQLFANMGNDQQGPAAAIPQGPSSGVQHLLPQQFSWLGTTRPLGPGEYIRNPDGSISSEESMTLPVDKQGNATSAQGADHWIVVPSLWLVNGVPTKVSEDRATELAQQSGLRWPSFPSEQQANQGYVNPREAKWESLGGPPRTDLQPPIWQYRK